MDSPVQKIKERLSIEEIVSSYIKLEKAGSNFKARCPFHNEKSASFFVSPTRGGYYCFGCGAKGDIFSFVQEFEGLDFRGALKLLAERAGIPLTNLSPEKKGETERIFQAMEEAALFFSKNLENHKEATLYLKSRGLEDKTMKDFRIGYIAPDWRLLFNHLAKRGFKEEELEKAGLIKKTDKGYYDRFRGRIMFPISDSSGRVIAFSGRIFPDDGKSAKYLNSPDTPIFQKSMVLYGLDKAKDSIRKNNFSILVEGQMDLIMSHQAGFKNTVATSGTALSDSTVSSENVVSNLGLARRLSQNIVLAFDADKAGFNAADRAAKIALSLGMDVKVAMMPEGTDPAELIVGSGVDAWREAIRNSKHIIEFMLARILKTSKDSRAALRGVKEKVLPYVSALESSIEQAHFLKIISESSQIPVDALKEDLKKIAETNVGGGDVKKDLEEKVTLYRKDNILRKLVGIFFWKREAEASVKIAQEVPRILETSWEKIIEEAKNREQDLIFEAEVFYGGNENLNKDVSELISNLEEECLREKLFRKMEELNQAELAKEVEKSRMILKEISDINSRIEVIKKGR